jgi:hypothetical protein
MTADGASLQRLPPSFALMYSGKKTTDRKQLQVYKQFFSGLSFFILVNAAFQKNRFSKNAELVRKHRNECVSAKFRAVHTYIREFSKKIEVKSAALFQRPV